VKIFKKPLFFSAYFINIALAKGLWEMTEDYLLKFLAVISPSLMLGAIIGHKSSNRARVIGLFGGILGVSMFAYFIDLPLE
jgi:hypothetical protein